MMFPVPCSLCLLFLSQCVLLVIRYRSVGLARLCNVGWWCSNRLLYAQQPMWVSSQFTVFLTKLIARSFPWKGFSLQSDSRSPTARLMAPRIRRMHTSNTTVTCCDWLRHTWSMRQPFGLRMTHGPRIRSITLSSIDKFPYEKFKNTTVARVGLLLIHSQNDRFRFTSHFTRKFPLIGRTDGSPSSFRLTETRERATVEKWRKIWETRFTWPYTHTHAHTCTHTHTLSGSLIYTSTSTPGWVNWPTNDR